MAKMKGDGVTKEKTWDIRERSLEYGVRAVRLYRALVEMKDGAALILGKQYLRSATSVGANIAEALSAESAADFIHKYSIAQKEARESQYWLALLERSEILSSVRLSEIKQETDELVAILTAIIVKRKKHLNNG